MLHLKEVSSVQLIWNTYLVLHVRINTSLTTYKLIAQMCIYTQAFAYQYINVYIWRVVVSDWVTVHTVLLWQSVVVCLSLVLGFYSTVLSTATYYSVICYYVCDYLHVGYCSIVILFCTVELLNNIVVHKSPVCGRTLRMHVLREVRGRAVPLRYTYIYERYCVILLD